MENIKEAFSKVKKDVSSLDNKIKSLSDSLSLTRKELFEVCDILKEIHNKNKELEDKNKSFEKERSELVNSINSISLFLEKNNKELLELNSFIKNNVFLGNSYPFNTTNFGLNNPTNFPINPTVPTHNPTVPTDIKALNGQFLGISTGNGGVPTDRQTNRQTDQQTNQHIKNDFSADFNTQNTLNKSSHNNEEKSISNAVKMLDSLDGLKKEIRLKFKRLTDQEITVFSTIYQFEEENIAANYKSLSKKLNLTESSIRDYVGRIIKKGIPIEKVKINNKQIELHISEDLKKIATLNTILQLRDL